MLQPGRSPVNLVLVSSSVVIEGSMYHKGRLFDRNCLEEKSNQGRVENPLIVRGGFFFFEIYLLNPRKPIGVRLTKKKRSNEKRGESFFY